MIDIGPLKARLQQFLARPGDELGRLARFVRFQIKLWRYCAQRLRENNLVAMSAALSFQTIFALIPALVLAFLVARRVGAVEDSKRELRRFLERTGFAQIAVVQDPDAPATTRPVEREPPDMEVINVADQIVSIVDRVEGKLTFERLGPIGGALLVWTALTLITTLERSLNRIFGAARDRSVTRRVLLYWSVMTLGPILLALANYLGNRAMLVVHEIAVLSWFIAAIGWLGPMVVGVFVLAAVYIMVPNTPVSYRAAAGGAFVGVVLWLVAKWGFSQYVQHLVVKGNLYGVLGVFPLFMMWLNLSWMIVLFGAELAHTASHLSRVEAADREELSLLSPLDALAVTLAVARNFETAGGPLPLDRIAVTTSLPAEHARWLIDRLSQRGVLCSVNGESAERYTLARPAARIPLTEVLDLAELRRSAQAADGDPIEATVARIQSRMNATVSELSLADVLQLDEPRSPPERGHPNDKAAMPARGEPVAQQ